MHERLLSVKAKKILRRFEIEERIFYHPVAPLRLHKSVTKLLPEVDPCLP